MRSPNSLIATLAALIVTFAGTAVARAQAPGAFTTRGAWRFVSAPRLHPPKLIARGAVIRSKLAPGYFLIDNFPNEARPGPMTGQGGPLILDNQLRPVWFAPTPTSLVSGDLQEESYRGAPVLVWWEGLVTRTGATTRGQVRVVDQHYRPAARVLKAKPPWVVSIHDAVINGSAIWVTVYRTVSGQNLAPYRGSRRGTVLDAGVQEYDLATGKLRFTWDALHHVPLGDSRQAVPASGSDAWDAYHVNSVQPLSGGQVLVSLRNTWAAYLIDSRTGRTAWTLGGRHSSFRFSRGARFAWQHDVHLVSGNRVTLFNDNCCELLPNHRLGPDSGPSTGMVLKLDPRRHRVSLISAFRHRPDLFTAFLGSMQLLPGGNALIGWGSLPYFSEVDRSGRQLLDVPFPGKDQTYRARFSSDWVGTPARRPSAAARRAGAKTTIYASFNGDTQTATWQVLGGPTATSMSVLATHSRTGFETAIPLAGSGDAFYEIIGLDAHGRQTGISKRFTAR